MMESEHHGSPEIKQCCASVYGSEAARFLLGESFHPGGTDLTLELVGMLSIAADSFVLDVASGRGTSVFAVAERFGCRVTGIDLSAANVAQASTEAAKRGLADRVTFVVADAEDLPFDAATFSAILCECAFCTFPDKAKAASEFARVLRPQGRVGISDLTRAAGPLPELDGLLAWVACIGDAQPIDRYADWLRGAGFSITANVTRNECLRAMVTDVRGKLMLAEAMMGLKKLELPGFDPSEAKRLANAADWAIRNDKLGYALLVGELN
jgi:arsenite methyltransferase